jgi:outer membrane protein assembly factor BamE (lipoprotein component of BamABCDE complex)
MTVRLIRAATTSRGAWASALALGLALGGCSPVVTRHGYAPPEEQVETIRPGIDTRGSVRRKIGRPGMDGVFGSDDWFYVSTTVEKQAFYAPEVTDRRIVAVSFDDIGVVQRVDRFGLEDGRIIDLETRTTPTFGRQLTIIQQILGNLGALDPVIFEDE